MVSPFSVEQGSVACIPSPEMKRAPPVFRITQGRRPRAHSCRDPGFLLRPPRRTAAGPGPPHASPPGCLRRGSRAASHRAPASPRHRVTGCRPAASTKRRGHAADAGGRERTARRRAAGAGAGPRIVYPLPGHRGPAPNCPACWPARRASGNRAALLSATPVPCGGQPGRASLPRAVATAATGAWNPGSA